MNTFSKKYSSFKNIVIVNGKRTPIGSFMGKLSNVHPSFLGSAAIDGAINASRINKDEVDEVIMGNVISAGIGQAPARQAAIRAGLKPSTICTTVNKVCSSGMKAVTIGAQSIMTNQSKVVVAGGFESMSLVPHYIYMRKPFTYGNPTLIDGIQHDGLTDAFDNIAMGSCAEKTNRDYKITRQEQDDYAIRSYERALDAISKGHLQKELIHITTEIKKGKSEQITEDEEPTKFLKDKIPTLKAVFEKDGGITAANASKINDGGCALVLMAEEQANQRKLHPIARIRGFADAECDPVDFAIAPSLAIKKLLKNINLTLNDIDLFEINEAFSSVILANMKILGIGVDKINLHGGAVALGHPIGMSGARIILSLINTLQTQDKNLGVAAICNGGGGSTAICIERLK